MGEELDYTTLKWVKNEIQESLNQARQALEAYVEDPSDSTQIRFCTTYLHQVYGTLQMVEIYGGALLAEEMEKVATALQNGEVGQKDDAYEVLMRTILQLPSYLEGLERGQMDMPVVLLPLLNDLRASRGANLLTENAFFAPDLSVTAPEPPPGKSYPELPVYAKKLRPVFQMSLLGWYRDKDAAGSLKKLAAVLRELQNASRGQAARRLWWIAGGVVEALIEGGLSTGTSVKLLVGHVDRELKRAIDQGEESLEAQPPTELLKNCLYYVGTAQSSGPRVSALKQAFQLDRLLPYSGDLEAAMDNLKGSNADLMETVSAVIKDDLLAVKDQLDIFVRNTGHAVAELVPLGDSLRRIADTLAMLGLGDLRKVVQRQTDKITALVESGEDPQDAALMEIASALLYVEASLDNLDLMRAPPRQAAEQPVEEEESPVLMPQSEQSQIINLVIVESRALLTDVKEGFNTFAAEPSSFEPITEAPEKLEQIKGALLVMNMERAAQLLAVAIRYIRDEVLAKQQVPDAVALDTLADVITSIEYYLEAVEQGLGHPETVLQVAELSIEQLGYSLTPEAQAEEVAEAEAGAEPPLAEEAAAEPFEELELGELETAEEAFLEETEAEAALPAEEEAAEPSVEEIAFEAETAEAAPSLETEAEIEFTPELEAEAEPAAAPTPAFTIEEEEEEHPEETVDEEILEIFIEEADEVLGTMTDCLHAWRADNEDRKSLETLRRSYHTIKGSGRLAGAMVMGDFAWAMENMLNRVMDGKVASSPAMFKLLEQAETTLAGLLAHLKGQADKRPPVKRLARLADAFAEGQAVGMADVVGEAAPAAPTAELPAEAEGAALAQETVEEFTEEREPAAETTAAEPEQEPEQIPEFEPEFAADMAAELGAEPEAESELEVEFDLGEDFDLELEAEPEISFEPEPTPEFGLEDELGPEWSLDEAALEEPEAIPSSEAEAEVGFEPEAEAELIEDLGFEGELESGPSLGEIAEEPEFELSEELEEEPEGELSAEAPAAAEPAPRFDPVLAEVFRKETETHLATLRGFLEACEAKESCPVSDALHRALHTLHGSARMAEVLDIAQLSEPMDRWVRVLLEHGIPMDAAGMDVVADFTAKVAEASEIFDTTDTPISGKQELLERIAALHAQALSTQAEAKPQAVAPAAAAPALGEEDMELLAVFLEEAEEILAHADELLQGWPEQLDAPSVVAELQRALHTLKGSARLANINAIGDLTHDMESVLEKVSEGRVAADSSLPAIIQAGVDWLHGAVAQVRDGLLVEAADAELQQRLAQWPAAGQPLPEEAAEQEVELEAPAAELEPEALGEEFAAPAEEITLEEGPAEQAEAPEEPAEEFEEIALPSAFAAPSPEPAAVPAPSGEKADYDEDLLEIFLEEAGEIQETTEQILEQWRQDIDNRGHVAELQRALHTLKGGARMANVTAVGDMAHAIESLLERITEGHLAADVRQPELIQVCHDWLTQALEQARQLWVVTPATTLLERLEAAIRGEYPAVAAVPEEAPVIPEPASAEPEAAQLEELPEAGEAAPQALAEEEAEEVAEVLEYPIPAAAQAQQAVPKAAEEQVRVRADLLNDLVNHAGEINIYIARIVQQLGAWRFNLAEMDQTVTRLREQLRKFEIETEAQIMYRHETEAASAHAEDFDPLELDRFSTMQQLSRGMAESLGDLTNIQSVLEDISGDTDTLLLQQQRVTSDLQDGLQSTRMVAFSSILPRLRRIVRQTATEMGKQVELEVQGAEGEVDRTQLNRLVPALEHVLRNAVDHGIEDAETRRAAGKPEGGKVQIDVAHEGSEVVLRIKDDGAGINIEAIKAKAVERGLMQADADLSDREIMAFVLESGFSTAKALTQISGRGVGMDVVNTEIKQLGGILQMDSKPGKGSTFTIRLPLTVLVNQALMVQVGDASYAIQLPNVEHVIRVGREELEALIKGEQTHIDYAGGHYQYMNLGTVLVGAEPLLPEGKQRLPLLLVRSGDHRVALQVDNLLGRQEIVIKSVGPQLSSVGVLSGATILPDGEVALILDMNNLVRSALAQQHGHGASLFGPQEERETEKRITVMVVDDSITVRKVTERLLTRYDYDIITAKDGVDALTVMLETIPDIMLLDVEMPRMDGFELATTMRNDPRLKDVPIIMITSRTGDKHRQRAMDIGVNEYMGKPYQEHELIDNIRSLTGKQG